MRMHAVFIEAVRHKRGVPLSADGEEAKRREEDCWYFRKLCDASRDGAIQLVTSMLSIAECTHIGEMGSPTKETRDIFVDLLTSCAVVDLVEPDIFVAERARDLRWVDGILLSGADSLHVASALISGCSEFITLDCRLTSKTAKFVIAVPKLKGIGLSVIRASQTAKLPAEYKTDDLFKDEKPKPNKPTQPRP